MGIDITTTGDASNLGTPTIESTIAKRFRAWRKGMGLTQAEAGALIGCSVKVVGRIERGAVSLSKLKQVAAIVWAYENGYTEGTYQNPNLGG